MDNKPLVSPTEDTTAPVITISNDAVFNYSVGDVWSKQDAESWCSAYDQVDGILLCELDDTLVDTDTAGTYTITYTAVDNSNNIATLQRTVTVTAVSENGITMTGYYASASGLTDNALIQQLRSILTSTYSGKNYDYAGSGNALWDTDKDPNNPTKLIEFYTGASVNGAWDSGATYNREHVWPQSLLGVKASGVNAASDLHNLKPANPSINSARGNKFYDWTTTTISYYPTRTDIHGDIARMLFYMVIMYDQYSLINTTPTTYQMAKLSTLLQWHLNDPVDAFEMRRNDRIQYHQGNRNPFIDYPELIQYMNIATA